MGDVSAGRHDDQGRPDRRVQRLSHGHHRRESRRSNIRSPAPQQDAFAVRVARTRPSAARAGRHVQGRNRSGDDQGPQGRHDRRCATNLSATARPSRAMTRPAPGLQEGRHRHRRATPRGHQRRRRRPRPDVRARKPTKRGSTVAGARSRAGPRAASIPSMMGIGPVPASQGARWRRPAGRSPIST